ncbi:GNAT family N-acetyltransferase [Xylanimonas allomyrinae]|uniref:GNAT family N-acetyltransferase n=1 Tax=Xylanimonas allomyrinae TaxID=2509459 RepID=A0A4P6EN88_9MICO|nr:GNAT family N-acetyltransferase [Xylanimonas allomyrinae]QAY62779.1 GNAT family N-acetyltransferase [Xylanimonas allomyrinae]
MTPLTDGAVLRPAAAGDEPGILACIHALAAYEREPDAVETTTQDLTAALFGPSPATFAHVVELDGQIVGIAVWFLTYSTWTGRHGIWLEDLFVVPEQRGKGFGLALLRELAALAAERGYRRLEWAVLKWNAPSITLYEAIGGRPQDEWVTYRLTGAALDGFAAGERLPAV